MRFSYRGIRNQSCGQNFGDSQVLYAANLFATSPDSWRSVGRGSRDELAARIGRSTLKSRVAGVRVAGFPHGPISLDFVNNEIPERMDPLRIPEVQWIS